MLKVEIIASKLTGKTADLEAQRTLCLNEQLEESARRIGFVRS